MLTLDSGKFENLEINSKTGSVRLGLASATQFTPTARLRIEQPAKLPGVGTYHPGKPFAVERDAQVVPLGTATTWVELTEK